MNLQKLILGALMLCVTGGALAATETWKLTVGGTSRNALVYAPSGLSKPALIIQLHGMNQDAAYQQTQAKWEPIADTGKFVVIFPNGLNKQWDISGTTDVNFVSALIDSASRRFGADRNRVYLSGFSMGGMFTYHAMNKMADKIAAFAPCSGYPLGGATAASSRPVPILHIHGTADDVVGYSGLEAVLAKWRSWNGCPTTVTTTKPYPAGKSASVTTRSDWGPCVKAGITTQVALLSNAGKGHWYSMDQASAVSSVEIWNFAKKYSLSTSGGTGTGGKLAPTVKFTTPLATGTYVAGSSLSVDVATSDADGTVSHIDFYDGITLIHSEWTAPYAWDWSGATAGTHVLKAIATDNDGNTAQDSVTITVRNGALGVVNVVNHKQIVHQVYDVQGNRLGEVTTDELANLPVAVGRMAGRPGLFLVRHTTELGVVTRKVAIGLP